jgi:hypothetical protein
MVVQPVSRRPEITVTLEEYAVTRSKRFGLGRVASEPSASITLTLSHGDALRMADLLLRDAIASPRER